VGFKGGGGREAEKQHGGERETEVGREDKTHQHVWLVDKQQQTLGDSIVMWSG
jgi:hypothetical protein